MVFDLFSNYGLLCFAAFAFVVLSLFHTCGSLDLQWGSSYFVIGSRPIWILLATFLFGTAAAHWALEQFELQFFTGLETLHWAGSILFSLGLAFFVFWQNKTAERRSHDTFQQAHFQQWILFKRMVGIALLLFLSIQALFWLNLIAALVRPK